MAARYFGINRGQGKVDVVDQATTPGSEIEIKIADTSAINQNTAIIQVQHLLDRLKEKNWPPA